MATRTVTNAVPYTECVVGQGNYDNNRLPIDSIIIHTMVGSRNGTRALFATPASQRVNHQPSCAHYGVNLDGSLDHFLEEYLVAYQAGNYAVNQRSIGIEHEDGGKPNNPRTDALYATSSKLVADICHFYSIPCDRNHIKKHTEVSDRYTDCPDGLDIDRIVAGAQTILNPTANTQSPNPPQTVATPTTTGIVTGNAYVRQTPTLTGGIVTTLAANTRVNILGVITGDTVMGNNKWFKIDTTQYIWSGLVQTQTSAVPSPSIPTSPSQPPTPVASDQDIQFQINALQQLFSIQTAYGFGNVEAAAREVCAAYPKYIALTQPAKKLGVVGTLGKLFGVK